MDIPEFKIVQVEGGFEVQDEHGTLYGPVVKTRKQAEEFLQDWKNYYNS